MGRDGVEAAPRAAEQTCVRFVHRLSGAVCEMPLLFVDGEKFVVSWPLCGSYYIFFPRKKSKGYGMTELRSDPPQLLKTHRVDELDLEWLLLQSSKARAAQKQKSSYFG